MHLERFALPLRPVLINFASTKAGKPYRFAEHRHNEYEFIYVRSGTYRCHLNGVPLTLAADSLLLVKPGDTHADEFRQRVRTFGLLFHFMNAPRIDTEAEIFAPGILPEKQWIRTRREVFMPYLSALERETSAGDEISPYLVETNAAAVFWLAVRHFPRSSIRPEVFSDIRDDGFSAKIISYFHSHASSPLNVNEMAAAFGLSAGFFAHQCTRLLGMPPMKAFTRYRMELAAALLAGGKNVTETSRTLGFQNPYHFSRVFKKIIGRSPAVFGAESRNGQAKS